MENLNINENLQTIFKDRFARYSKYIIQDRALPDARDGLKPVQRRIIYAMYYDGNNHKNAYRKSAKSVGLIIGNFHPHGDYSVYEAMVRMSQSWKLNEVLIDMQGNNGSIDNDPAAAMRYTEARLSKFATNLLDDIEYDSVKWAYNFDDTLLEPTVLPAKLPLLLLNGSTGIAAGYATEIPPHNLAEIIDACIYFLNNPDADNQDLMSFIKGPDFPTGAIIQGENEIKKAYETGKGRVVIRGRHHFDQKKNQIIITEIPYEVVKSNLVSKIDEIRINKEIDGISDVRDESDRSGLRIVIDLKKGSNVDFILKYLYKNTDLQIYYNFNMVAIVDDKPKLLSLKEIISAFLRHKKEVVLNRSNFLKKKYEERLHILEGLIYAVSIIDEIIDLIKASNNKTDAINKLIENYNFTQIQAETIVNLRLYRLTNTDIKEFRLEMASLNTKLLELKQIIENQVILNNTIINELKEVKENYAKKRLTLIEKEIETINIAKEDLITKETVVISISKDGYLKKATLKSYSAFENIGKFKENDKILHIEKVDNLNYLLFFTDLGNYGVIPIYELEYSKWMDIGKHFNTYLKSDEKQKIIKAYIIKDFNSDLRIVSLTKMGYLKLTAIKDLEVSRTSKLYQLMKFKSEDDRLVAISESYDPHDEVLIINENASYNYYPLSSISTSKTKTSGLIGIKASPDNWAKELCIINNVDKTKFLVLFNVKGGAKKIKISDLKKTSRARKGESLTKKQKTKLDEVKKAFILDDYDFLKIISKDELTNLSVSDIALLGTDKGYGKTNYDSNYFILETLKELEKIVITNSDEKSIPEAISLLDELF